MTLQSGLRWQVKLSSSYKGLAEATKESINEWVEHWITTLLDSYLASYLKHEDAEIVLKIAIEKNWNMYNGAFHLTWPSLALDFKRESFENLRDLVNHAFKHFKEWLSSK